MSPELSPPNCPRTVRTVPELSLGDNTAVPVGITTDILGNPRVVDDPAADDNGYPPEADELVDMGAYEYPCGTCPWDLGPPGPNGQVGPEDLGYLLGCWGPVAPGDACECLDIGPPEPNGNIGPEDLGELLGAWGPCP